MNLNNEILIVEPDHGGHRANHVGIIARYLRSKSIEPKLLTSKKSKASQAFDQFGLAISCFDDETNAISLPIYARFLPPSLRQQLVVFRQISSYLKTARNRTQWAIFPTLQASGLIPAGLNRNGFPIPWVGIVMAPGAHLREHSIKTHHSAIELRVQRKSYRGIVKQTNCIKIGSFDPLFAEWMNDSKVVYCPDPVTDCVI